MYLLAWATPSSALREIHLKRTRSAIYLNIHRSLCARGKHSLLCAENNLQVSFLMDVQMDWHVTGATCEWNFPVSWIMISCDVPSSEDSLSAYCLPMAFSVCQKVHCVRHVLHTYIAVDNGSGHSSLVKGLEQYSIYMIYIGYCTLP